MGEGDLLACPYRESCGGCSQQGTAYHEQVARKEAVLHEILAPIGLPDLVWEPFIPCPGEYPRHFRNKIRFGFTVIDGTVQPARHSRQSEAANVPVLDCALAAPQASAIARWIAAYATASAWTVDQPPHRPGWLKHLLYRDGSNGQALVAVVTDSGPLPEPERFTAALTGAFPTVIGVAHCQSFGRRTDHLETTHLWGDRYVWETVGEYRFPVSLHAFFQTNRSLVATLYETTARYATHGRNPGSGSLWDLYAGTATIGTFLNRSFASVQAIESNPANTADAALSLRTNHVENLTVHTGTVESVCTSAFIRAHGSADVLVVDPPRSGLSPDARRFLLGIAPPVIVAVSCNPETLRRDLAALCQFRYSVTNLCGLDCFPHSDHCETVVRLQRR